MIFYLRRFLGSTNFAIFLVALIFAAIIWFLGGFIGWGEFWPVADTVGKAIWIGVIFGIAFLTMILLWILRKRRERRLEADIVESVEEALPDEAISGELSELRDKLKGALAKLKKSKLGRRSLYELPWYIIIGPPGAGKTTAIVNSGLDFPLADEMGKGAIGGVGGTRNCDWWFTNDAVLIDTAGRYTTQESDQETDNAGWLGFLGLLKKNRKRQPINGAIVAISLADLSQTDEQTQKSHANAVRRRLHELREKLGVRFPVYVLFTKADLIAGFAEFYENLGKEERGQVWGFTLPLPKGKKEASPIEAFDDEYSGLLAQLNAQLLEKMQGETDHQRRSLIAGFPGQVASIRQVAKDFLGQVFQDNRFEQRHLLRGVYFTSGTQEGTPIDRLMMGMARTFGIGRQAIGSGTGTGRSFFLTKLFNDVIFKEAGLVSADDKVERRYRWTVRGAIVATVIVTLGMGFLWTRSFLGNREMIATASAGVAEYRTAAAAIPGSPIGDSDLPSLVPALNKLRDLPGNPAQGDIEIPGELTWGLYQGRIIGSEAEQSYRAALNQHMLPRLLLRLEDVIQGSLNNPDVLYDALKVYLMLGLQGPMEKKVIEDWMAADWAELYPGISRDQLRKDLAGHLDVMLSNPMKQIALNGPLVEQAQQILSQMPIAQRVYNGIINSAAAQALPPWRITDIGGPAVARAMVRSSGKPLNEGIEGIYTYNGFRTVFLEEALSVAKRVQRESWVMGKFGQAEQSEAALLSISRDVLSLYYNDFIARYDGILADLDIIPLESLPHAVDVTNILSGPTSPIVNILNAVAVETSLAEDHTLAGAAANSSAANGVKQVGAMELTSALSVQAQVFLEALTNADKLTGQKPEPPGQYVQDRFQWLHDLVTRTDGQPSQLDGMMDTLTQVYQELNKLSINGGVATTADGGASALQQFQAAAARIPGPLQRWATQIATGSSGITAEGTRASINAQWQSQVLPFCDQALANRYPFSPRAKADVAMADFTKLFSPGGMIDSFFSQNLAKFVDTRSRPWVWKTVNSADLGISPQVLAQFQAAAEIRDAFFPNGPNVSINFQITPEAFAPDAQSVTLEIDGTKVDFTHRDGQPTPTAVTWPGSVGLARVSFQPAANGVENGFSRDGPWAWFRLLDAAEVRRTGASDRSRVIFNVGGRIAIYQLQSGSVLNPFSLPALGKFSCPKSF